MAMTTSADRVEAAQGEGVATKARHVNQRVRLLERDVERDAAVFTRLIDPLLEALPGRSPYADTAEQASAARDADRAKRDRLQTEHQRRDAPDALVLHRGREHVERALDDVVELRLDRGSSRRLEIPSSRQDS